MIYDRESWLEHRASQKSALSHLAITLYNHETHQGRRITEDELAHGRHLQAYLDACDGKARRLEMFLKPDYAQRDIETRVVLQGIHDAAQHAVIAGEGLHQVITMARQPELVAKLGNITLGAVSQGLTTAFTDIAGSRALLPARAENMLKAGDYLRQQYPYVHGQLGEAWIQSAMAMALEAAESVAGTIDQWVEGNRKVTCTRLLTKLRQGADSLGLLQQRPL